LALEGELSLSLDYQSVATVIYVVSKLVIYQKSETKIGGILEYFLLL
jgi:hypothetical protein